MTADELKNQLAHFTGTEQWYKTNEFPWYAFTEGVKFFIEQTQSPWVLFLANDLAGLAEDNRFINLQLEIKDQYVSVRTEDGNDNELSPLTIIVPPGEVKIPNGLWVFWLVDQTLMLPSEY